MMVGVYPLYGMQFREGQKLPLLKVIERFNKR